MTPESWYCRINGKVEGPLSLRQIQEMAMSGNLQGTDYVRQGERASWLPAGNFPQVWTAVAFDAIPRGTLIPQEAEPLPEPAEAPRTVAPRIPTLGKRPESGAEMNAPLYTSLPGSAPAARNKTKTKTKAKGKSKAKSRSATDDDATAPAPQRKLPWVPLAISGAVFGLVVFFVLSLLMGGKFSVEESLKRDAVQANKSLPRQLDPDVRFDSVTAGPGRKVTFRYTLSRFEGGEPDSKTMDRAQAVKAATLKLFRTSKEADYYRRNNVEIICKLRDMHQRDVTSVRIRPGEY